MTRSSQIDPPWQKMPVFLAPAPPLAPQFKVARLSPYFQRLMDIGRREIDAYVPHAMALLDQAIFATLSSDEISVLIDLLSRVETASRQLISKREGKTG